LEKKGTDGSRKSAGKEGRAALSPRSTKKEKNHAKADNENRTKKSRETHEDATSKNCRHQRWQRTLKKPSQKNVFLGGY